MRRVLAVLATGLLLASTVLPLFVTEGGAWLSLALVPADLFALSVTEATIVAVLPAIAGISVAVGFAVAATAFLVAGHFADDYERSFARGSAIAVLIAAAALEALVLIADSPAPVPPALVAAVAAGVAGLAAFRRPVLA